MPNQLLAPSLSLLWAPWGGAPSCPRKWAGNFAGMTAAGMHRALGGTCKAGLAGGGGAAIALSTARALGAACAFGCGPQCALALALTTPAGALPLAFTFAAAWCAFTFATA
eukprot:7422314-Pyramimonas_sp.AAC.2